MTNDPSTAAPRRRFAPVPIETTFEQFRKSGPAAEPTPSPSPRSPVPPPLPSQPPREKRRFAPQLVESIRRSRRAGDEGPATRHTDRTDITPYTRHIYAHKTKKKGGHHGIPVSRRAGHARRESCDDEIAGDVFDLVARDAQLKLQEVAMSAFPNSGIRIGGAEHFYVREGSEDDSIPSRGRSQIRVSRAERTKSQQESSEEEDPSWAFKEMREHAHVTRDRDRVSTWELDRMSIDGPPSDAMGLTRARESISSSPLWPMRGPSSGSLGPIGEAHMPLIRADSPLPTIGESVVPPPPPASPPPRAIGEVQMPYIPSAAPGMAAHMPYVPASQIPPESGFRTHASPFRKFGNDRDMSLERARNLHRLRNNSPPMLGKELTFRMCPSPQHTKLEPDHMWDLETGTAYVESNRDPTENKGLWRGYCYANNDTQMLAPVEREKLVSTPFVPSTPADPFATSFHSALSRGSYSEEPTPEGGQSWYRARNQEPKGLHMLQGLDERLRKEKENAELEERIQAEFNDTFVTQVYNYLSLGYPATARAFDEELSKISRIEMIDLERDDQDIMDGACGGTSGAKVTGHIMLDREERDGVNEEERCPRWKALKLYIFEWARQHPDLSGISPLAWGVRERRGSWGI